MTNNKKIGSPIGPRPLFWFCVAQVDGKFINDRISSKGSDYTNEQFTSELAAYEFSKKHGVSPDVIDGPARSANLPQKKSSGKKVVFNQATMTFTGEKRKVSYKGWKGIAHIVKDEKNNKAAVFLFESELSPKKGRSKAEPKAKIVPISMLE